MQRKGYVPGWPLPELSADRSAGGSGQRSFDELGEPLREITFVVVDLETTGGSSLTEAITEIGAVKVRGGEVLGEFATLVDPGRSIPPQITILTGITDSMVYDAPRIGAVLPSFLEFIRGSVLVAHNAPFDVGFLKAACARLGLPWPGPAVVDTVRLARKVLSRDEAPSVRLSALAPLLGARVAPDHRALTDARATVDVLHALFERLGSLGVHSLSELQDASRDVSPERRRKRRLADHLPAAPGRLPVPRAVATRCSTSAPRATCTSGSGRTSRRPRPASRIKQMVTLAERVDHVECAHALEAHVREQRLIAIHQPPYNRRSRKPRQGQLGDAHRRGVSAAEHRPHPARRTPRSASVRSPPGWRPQTAVEALQDAVPIRRCTTRIRRIEPGRQPLRAGRTRPLRCALLRRGGRDSLRRPCRPDRGTDRRPIGRDPARAAAGAAARARPVGPLRPGRADPRPAVRAGRRRWIAGSGSARWPASPRSWPPGPTITAGGI